MISIKRLKVVFLNIIFILFMSLFMYFSMSDISHNWYIIISILSILSLIVQIISQRELGFGIYDFIPYFFLFSHIFMFGNVYLLAINKVEFISWGLIYRYDVQLLFESAWFILLYLQILNIGVISFTMATNKCKSTNKNKNKENNKVVKYIGGVMFIISAPFRLLIDIENIIAAQAAGSYYALESKSGISDDLAILFVPAIIYLLNSSISKKKKNTITIIFVAYSAINMVLTGDRRYQFIGAFVVLLNYLYINKIKIKFSNTAIISVLGIVSLNFISQISEIRQKSLVSISVFLSEYWSKFLSTDFAYKILGEFGISFMTVVIAFKNIPKVLPYQKGLSFWGAIPTILPIGWLFPNFFYKVSIYRRLYAIEGYPVGASLPGELYANFGWLSLIVVFVIGAILGKYFKIERLNNNSIEIAKYFSIFYIIINIIRASFIEILRSFFVVTLIPLFIYLFFKSKLSKRER